MKVTWFVDDGYVGGNSRPHTCTIDDSEIEYCETKQEFEDLVSQIIQEDFENKISTYFNMPEFKQKANGID